MRTIQGSSKEAYGQWVLGGLGRGHIYPEWQCSWSNKPKVLRGKVKEKQFSRWGNVAGHGYGKARDKGKDSEGGHGIFSLPLKPLGLGAGPVCWWLKRKMIAGWKRTSFCSFRCEHQLR